MSYRSLLSILTVCLALGLTGCQESSRQNKPDSYPWQVTAMADGSSRIFGIHLRTTTVAEAKQLLGNEPKLALFENPDGGLSLELFYNEFTRAGLSGKLILTLSGETAVLQSLKQQAAKAEKLESGVSQYRLGTSQQGMIDGLPVVAMTYVPYANLEEKVIQARFGEPTEKIRSHPQAEHWLYPQMGLDLIVNEVGKEVLQYVPPKEFASLARPLKP